VSETPRLALPYIATGQAQKEVTHNEALNRLDALVQPVVVNSTTSAPPGSPANGQAWIVAAGASGAWAGKEGQIAAWFGGWVFLVPEEGWRVHNKDDGATWVYDGSAWAAEAIDHSPGAWQVPSLNLGWIGLGGAWGNPRYRKAKDGLVTIEGAMQHPTASMDGVIFTLLSGYRPELDLIFIGYSAGGAFRINVKANGDVEVAGSNMFFSSFSGVSFYAA
jgi:hypothetical protein